MQEQEGEHSLVLGDLLFYPAGTRWSDRLIAWWTHSPFVHVEIDLGDGTTIGADGIGICIHPREAGAVRWRYIAHADPYDLVDLDRALAWARTLVGTPYGAGDLVTAVLHRLPFYVAWKRRYDCSAFACQFLIRAGGIDLGRYGEDPHTATPGGLARQLGVGT